MVMTTYIYNPKAHLKYGKFIKTGNTYAFKFGNDLCKLANTTYTTCRGRTHIKVWGLDTSIEDLLNHPDFITFTADSHPEYFI